VTSAPLPIEHTGPAADCSREVLGAEEHPVLHAVRQTVLFTGLLRGDAALDRSPGRGFYVIEQVDVGADGRVVRQRSVTGHVGGGLAASQHAHISRQLVGYGVDVIGAMHCKPGELGNVLEAVQAHGWDGPMMALGAAMMTGRLSAGPETGLRAACLHRGDGLFSAFPRSADRQPA